METKMKRGLKEGIEFGLIAGVIFGLVEILVSAMMGNPPLQPIRMFASVVLGETALQSTELGSVVVIGAVVHLALSALFGLIYGAINGALSRETETSWGRQAGIGLVFGVLLWFVNFQLIARAIYPWFLDTPQALQAALHAVFFGLPLALMYAAAERRVQLHAFPGRA